MRGRSDGPGIGLAAENGGNPGLAFLLMDVKIKTVMNLWKWIPVAVVSCCCSFDTGYGQDIAASDMPDVDEYRKTPEFEKDRLAIARQAIIGNYAWRLREWNWTCSRRPWMSVSYCRR